jgi:hypothetical protein
MLPSATRSFVQAPLPRPASFIPMIPDEASIAPGLPALPPIAASRSEPESASPEPPAPVLTPPAPVLPLPDPVVLPVLVPVAVLVLPA